VEKFQRLTDLERRVIDTLIHRTTAVRDPNAAFDTRLTIGERIADRVAMFGGSWTFIILFLAAMMVWMMFNAEAPRRFDPYPFILLNLVLSCLAALQAPIIMMSQNRQAAKDRSDAQHDYEVNLKAEMEIAALHLKVDELAELKWAALLHIQQQQLTLLRQIHGKLNAG
jgi:uncharacterized membrane protein